MESTKVNDKNYLHIEGWMRTQLGLKGNELMIYALIYGFSQDGDSWFCGSAGYISEWVGITRQQVMILLKKLVSRKLIVRQEKTVNGVKLVDYKAIADITPCQETLQGGCKETLHHTSSSETIELKPTTEVVGENTDIKNHIFQKAEAERAINLWNSIPSLPNVIKLSDKRKTALKNLLKEYDWGQFELVIENVKSSSFLNGTGKWACTFDWILNRNNFLKVLEGNYNDREEKKNNGCHVAHKDKDDYRKGFGSDGKFNYGG